VVGVSLLVVEVACAFRVGVAFQELRSEGEP
jgi:hypothetical protein